MAVSQDPLPGRNALVLYGSETGNAQDVAEEIGRMAQRLRFSIHVSEMNAVNLRQLLSYSVVLIAISTTGQGDLPANAQTLWKSLRSVRLRPGCMQQLLFASFGLGDSSYPKFNFAHRKLYNRLLQLGAKPLCDRAESDEQHPEGVDGVFISWSLKLRERLLEEFPLPDGVTPIPDEVLLSPKWELQFIGSHSDQASDPDPAMAVKDTPPDDLLPIPDSITVTVEDNSRITPTTHWQDVRRVSFIAKPLTYQPGDVLTIYPKNFPADVDHFLHIMGWSSFADVPLKFTLTTPQDPADAESSPQLPLANLPSSGQLTLRMLLTSYLDIMAIPRRSFFAALAHFTSDLFQKDRLLEFTNPEYLDELYDYTTRPRRSILEVLQEFETVKLPWQWICNILPPLRGRQFSIASGGKVSKVIQDGTRIELLVAIVKYRTVIKRIRQGVCTRYITSLSPGQRLNVTLQRGSLGLSITDFTRPVVLVGPGTGVAPIRALIYERLWKNNEAQSNGNAAGEVPLKNILFFGCRNESADYFFKDEWTSLVADGKLEVFTAFSRDQQRKVYVQDLIRKEAQRVYDTLGKNNGIVFICGSSGKMPQAVREALIEVFQSEGHLSRENAEAFLVSMEKTGRYKQETW